MVGEKGARGADQGVYRCPFDGSFLEGWEQRGKRLGWQYCLQAVSLVFVSPSAAHRRSLSALLCAACAEVSEVERASL